MPRRKKGAVRPGHGVRCNICGKDCGKGGGLAKHLEAVHEMPYKLYKLCFYAAKRVITNTWDEQVSKKNGTKAVFTHVLVRKFVGERGPRGTPRAA
jgi:hypothetical protein